MSLEKKLENARTGTDWLTSGLTEAEIKTNHDLGVISTEIELRRLEMNMNQKEFAKLLGVTQGMISKYESGEYNFSIKTLREVCSKIGLELSLLVHKPEIRRSHIKLSSIDSIRKLYHGSSIESYKGIA